MRVLPEENIVQGEKNCTKAGKCKEIFFRFLLCILPVTEDVLTSAPHGKHVEDDGEDSDNFLVLLWLVQLVNLEVSLTTKIQRSGFVEIFKSSLM